MRKTLSVAFLLVLITMLTSCKALSPGFSNYMGNMAFQQGDYQKATVFYLKALKREISQDILYYNMGNVFYALGEGEAAREIWLKAEESASLDIRFRIQFNMGVLYYQQGLYEEACNSFKTALSIRPENWETKANLELSLRKMSKLESRSSIKNEGSGPALNDDSVRILQYIKKKEELYWTGAQEEPQDYQKDW